jgi:hypothetical protein
MESGNRDWCEYRNGPDLVIVVVFSQDVFVTVPVVPIDFISGKRRVDFIRPGIDTAFQTFHAGKPTLE